MRATLSKFFGATLFSVASLTIAAEIDVMTQNQYLGAELTPVLVAGQSGDPVAFNAAVVQALGKIAATRPAVRVRALSWQIQLRAPDVVGVQEAYEFTCAPLSPEQQVNPCEHPQLKAAFTNHLADTVRGLWPHYVLAAKVTNLKVEGIPFTLDGTNFALLGVTDRDAIFVRKPWKTKVVTLACQLPSDDGCNFLTRPDPLSLLGTTVNINRGYAAVDVTVKGRDYRVFNTHLEQRELVPGLTASRFLQVGQAYELLQAALVTAYDPARLLVVVGDFNSAPVDVIPVPPFPPTLPSPPFAPNPPTATPYQIFAGAGFVDAWTRRWFASPGYTCCQDEDLRNAESALYERIDLIWLKPPAGTPASALRAFDVRRLGALSINRIWIPGVGAVWPSDHAAVAAEVHFDW